MTVTASDLQWRLSGGANNIAADASSLGGVMSYAEPTSCKLDNLFDTVSASEATVGNTEYRCIYIRNAHATDTISSVKVWIASDSTESDTSIAIGLDPAGVGDGVSTGVATTPSNDSTPPSGVSFSTPASYAAGLSIGTLTAGQAQAIWIKRIVNALATATGLDECRIQVRGAV